MSKKNKISPAASAPTVAPAPANDTPTHGALALAPSHALATVDAAPLATVDAPAVEALATVETSDDTPTHAAPGALTQQPTEPDPSYLDRHGAGFVDQIGKARVNAGLDLLKSANTGLSGGVEAWERGYTVMDLGVKNAKKKHAEWAKLPIAEEGLDDLYATVTDEKRDDETIDTNKLRAAPDGFLFLVDAPERRWKIEPAALRDLADDLKSTIPPEAIYSPANFAAYLESCPPEKRSEDWNYWQDKAIEQRAAARDAADKTAKSTNDLVLRTQASNVLARLDRVPTSKLRTRKDASGARSIFGTVGEGWVPIDVDHVALMVKRAIAEIDGDIRARINYSGRNVKIDIITHSNVQPENYVAGEIFQISARIGTDDTGGGSIYGYAAITQNLCRNLIILHEAKGNHFRVVHRGDPMVIMNKIVTGLKESLNAVAAFAPQWTNACNDRLIIDGKVLSSTPMRSDSGDSPLQLNDRQRFEIFAANAAGVVTKRSGSNYLVPMPGTSDKQRVQKIVPELLRHFAADLKDGSSAVRTAHDGLTRAALVNSLTRFAHESERDAFRGADLEKAAGSILAGARGTQWTIPSETDWESYEVNPVDLVTAAAVV